MCPLVAWEFGPSSCRKWGQGGPNDFEGAFGLNSLWNSELFESMDSSEVWILNGLIVGSSLAYNSVPIASLFDI